MENLVLSGLTCATCEWRGLRKIFSDGLTMCDSREYHVCAHPVSELARRTIPYYPEEVALSKRFPAWCPIAQRELLASAEASDGKVQRQEEG